MPDIELPSWMQLEWEGHALRIWMALPLGLLTAYLLASVLVRLLGIALRWGIKSHHKTFYQHYIEPVLPPFKLWLSAAIFAGIVRLLPLGDTWSKRTDYVIGTIATFAIVWALSQLITRIGEQLREYFIARERVSAAAIIPLMRKLAKTSIGVIALLFLLQNWGFDIMALLAGLGIGGVAVALASQKTVENLFGGVSITLDQPVRVGDFISFSDNVGTVEDIGLRSTSIRTPSRTRVVIPNSQFSEMKLENFAPRDKILLKKVFGVRYDTRPEQMRGLIASMENYFSGHERIEKGGRARFVNFGDSSLELEIFLYVTTSDYNEFLVIQQEILLRIIEIVQAAGLDFAFSSTSLYLEKTKGLKEMVEAARGEVTDS